MFERFPSLTRFSQGWSISEKIDGTNAQVIIDNLASSDDVHWKDKALAHIPDEFGGLFIFAGSRSKLITPKKDNFGFARWVQQNAEMLVTTLGQGRHFGEWWGVGIQRGYNISERRFSLFNTFRWKQEELIAGLHVVPSLMFNDYCEDPGTVAKECLERLRNEGSLAAPGFMNPEGIVMYHRKSGTSFKKTFDYDEHGKWMEQQEARTE